MSTLMESSICSVDLSRRELSAEEMDTKRQMKAAYEYLCRLHEVRSWLVDCMGEEGIPQATDLEENFRNGVVLAKLANYFAPHVVPKDKIYDSDQAKFNAAGTVYRHTDNIVLWRNAMIAVRLPEIIIPETVDVYEGRNVRTVFALYALAIHLFRLRKAPPIHNQSGKLQFSDDELAGLMERLKDLNTSLPPFGELGSFLTEKVATDEDKRATLVKEINKDIHEKDAQRLLEHLLHADAHFLYVERSLIDQYMQNLATNVEQHGRALSAEEIQSAIVEVNDQDVLRRLEQYLSDESSGQDLAVLSQILLSIEHEKVFQILLPFYDESLRDVHKRSAASDGLTICDVKQVLEDVNISAAMKRAALEGDPDELFRVLSHKQLGNVRDVLDPTLKDLYFRLTRRVYKAHPERLLKKLEVEELIRGVGKPSEEHLQIEKLITACDDNDLHQLGHILRELGCEEVDYARVQFYARAIKEEKESLEASHTQERLSKPRVLELVALTNKAVDDEVLAAKNVLLLDTLLSRQAESRVREFLPQSCWQHKQLIQMPALFWYYPALKDALDVKRRRLNIPANTSLNCILRSTELCDVYATPCDEDIDALLSKPFAEFEESVDISFTSPGDAVPDEWPLSNDEIEDVLRTTNQNFADHCQSNEQHARKIQQEVRKYLVRKNAEREAKKRNQEALDELQNSSAPSLNSVRKYVETLRLTDIDYHEEILIERTRTKITRLINQNRKLDEDLGELDRKIGLLVKNMISAEEVVEHKDKIERDLAADQMSKVKYTSKNAVRAYEMLFFHLQTDPEYLGNLFDAAKETPTSDLFLSVVFPIFHFASDKREEFLLVYLFSDILRRYVKSLGNVSEFLNDQPRTERLVGFFSAMFRSFPSQSAITVALKNDLMEFQQQEPPTFNLNPVEIYDTLHEGQKAKDLEQAMSDPQVVEILEGTKQFLVKWSHRFAESIVSTVHLPKSVRYIARICMEELRTHFTDIRHSEATRLASEFLYRTFFEHPMTSPQMIRRETNHQLTQRQQEILHTVSKVMSTAVFGKGFSTSHLRTMNTDLQEISKQFMSFIGQYVEASSSAESISSDSSKLDSIYEMNQYSAFLNLSSARPVLSITLKDVETVRDCLQEHKAEVAPDPASGMRQLLEKLPIVGDKEAPATEHITLNLHPMPLDNADKKVEDANELLIETRKNVVDLLLSGCPGDTIEELLLPNNEDDEVTSGRKQSIRANLERLEELGLVSSDDHYQRLVNQIAKDIQTHGQYRENRDEQLRDLTTTAQQLEEKRVDYDDQLEKYKQCLESCLENMTTRRPSVQVSNGTKAEKELRKRSKADKTKVVKIPGDKLMKKDLVIKDDRTSAKELSKLTLEIHQVPEKKGVFEVWIRRPKQDVVVAHMDFQDILGAEHDDAAEYVLENQIHLNPTNFRIYLYRKFYAHQK